MILISEFILFLIGILIFRLKFIKYRYLFIKKMDWLVISYFIFLVFFAFTQIQLLFITLLLFQAIVIILILLELNCSGLNDYSAYEFIRDVRQRLYCLNLDVTYLDEICNKFNNKKIFFNFKEEKSREIILDEVFKMYPIENGDLSVISYDKNELKKLIENNIIFIKL